MEECCATNGLNETNHHLVIIGGGSAAFAAATKASEMGHRVTMINVSELASSFHAYLTLGEAIKLATITFGKDVSKLSCCAT